MRALTGCLGFISVLATAAPAAHADERPPRQVGLHRTNGTLAVSVGLQDLFWLPTDGERLKSGFASSVLIRVELFREGGKQPIAQEARSTYIVYDIWDERFRVRPRDAGGAPEVEVSGLREAVERATVLIRFRVTELDRLEVGAVYRLRFRADLNPLSQELMQDVRKWLVRPPGQGRSSTGDSAFGSLVSFFVNPRIEESERQLSFVSQAFVARPPEEVHP
jgi:hypothetical protein